MKQEELVYNIKKDYGDFDEEKFLEFAKYSIKYLYNELKDSNPNDVDVLVDKKVVDKMIANKSDYKLDNDMDTISINYAKIINYVSLDNKYIKIKVNVNMYDDVDNNSTPSDGIDKTWSESWIVTFKNINNNNDINKKCINCGGPLIYQNDLGEYKCTYCNSIFQFQTNKCWEIDNIEVE